jgi:hypothetical protein
VKHQLLKRRKVMKVMKKYEKNPNIFTEGGGGIGVYETQNRCIKPVPPISS